MNKFSNILITGCSSGIGYCVAHGLKDRGYRVFATARKLEDVKKLQKEGLESLQLDLDSSESIQSAYRETMERTKGKLDVLFNNGAYGQPGAVEDLSREVLLQQLQTNLLGTHELTLLALKTMRSQGYGRIIHNSSLLGFVSLPFRGAYNCSKYALEGLTDTLRLELKLERNHDIHVSLIEPGPISSRFRTNAHIVYQRHIDKSVSHFLPFYDAMERRLTKEGPAAPFTLPPEAVLEKIIHAIEAKKPKERYYVTFPTWIFAIMKRLLTHRGLDRLMLKISKDEHP